MLPVIFKKIILAALCLTVTFSCKEYLEDYKIDSNKNYEILWNNILLVLFPIYNAI